MTALVIDGRNRRRGRTAPASPGRIAALAAVVALIALLASGCADGHGTDSTITEVTVTAAGDSVTVPAAYACVTATGDDGLKCSDTVGAAPHLAVPPGTPLDISVPENIAAEPWVIVFEYVDPAGDQQQDRTGLFSPASRSTYHLDTPPGAQLTRLEVQTVTAAPATTAGGVSFPVTGAWKVTIDPPDTSSPGETTTARQENNS